MALDGTAWTGVFAAMGEYLRGETPNELTPVAGGDAVAFNQDGQYREVVVEGNVRLARVRLNVTTQEPLQLAASYTWGGHTWEVADDDTHQVGAGVGPRHYSLVRHGR